MVGVIGSVIAPSKGVSAEQLSGQTSSFGLPSTAHIWDLARRREEEGRRRQKKKKRVEEEMKRKRGKVR